MRKKILLILLSVLLLPSFAACSQQNESTMPPVASGTVVVTQAAQIPNTDPSIKGYITRINYSAESTEILVEYYAPSDAEPEYSYDKALVKLDSNSAIADRRNNPMSISDLTIGSTVEVWFSEPSAESYPILTYGQAVRTVLNTENFNGVSGLPLLSVSSSSSSIAVVTKAEWAGLNYDFEALKLLLEKTYGAHLSAHAGDTVTLNFSKQPDSVTVTCSSSTLSAGTETELSEDMKKFTIPEDAEGELYFRVNAEWAGGTAQYAFAVVILAPAA